MVSVMARSIADLGEHENRRHAACPRTGLSTNPRSSTAGDKSDLHANANVKYRVGLRSSRTQVVVCCSPLSSAGIQSDQRATLASEMRQV